MNSWFLLVAVIMTSVQPVMAACVIDVLEEEKTISVKACEEIIPAQHPLVSRVMGNILDDAYKSLIEKDYTGLVVMTGSAKYFVKSSVAQSCAVFNSRKAVKVLIKQACCDGDPNAPCLLGIDKYIEEVLSKP